MQSTLSATKLRSARKHSFPRGSRSERSLQPPAEFVVEFAHAIIDAGAGVVVGHGPHVLRAIEVYKGRPIFYSLAIFIFDNDLVELQPADSYKLLGLDGDSLPSDYFTERSKNDTTRFPADRKYWQSVVAEVVYNNNRTL